MIKSAKSLVTFLDRISQHPNISAASKSLGASATLPYIWIKQAAIAEREGDTSSIYYLEWPVGSESFAFFNRLVSRARDLYKYQFEANFRAEQMPVDEGGGVVEPLIFNGEIQYEKRDPILQKQYVEFGLVDPEDVWERDGPGGIKGKRKIQYVRRPSPAHSKIHATRSLLGDQGYNDKRELHISGGIAHGVVTLPPARPQRPALAAPSPSRDGDQPASRDADPSGVTVTPVEPDNRTELDKFLAHLDTMPPSPLVEESRRWAIERATRKPQHRGVRPAPSSGANDPPEYTGAGQPAARPYVSPESRSEGIGRGEPKPGGARVAGGEPERGRVHIGPEGYPVSVDPNHVDRIVKMV
jgi:hypothetical protein